MSEIHTSKLEREAAKQAEKARRNDATQAVLHEQEAKIAAGQHAIRELFNKKALVAEAEELDIAWKPEFDDVNRQQDVEVADEDVEMDDAGQHAPASTPAPDPKKRVRFCSHHHALICA